ncbi:MAG TPA: NAD(P)H-binding protein [Vicinamibacterales bacterium]|jgi:uncharacterized protein YbjT (DUF2867 family)|nr:NAD(P)H-binding protein [Vicinamibacterales bacterium]
MKRILVTGATGNVGREVVKQLRASGCPVRAMSRTPQSAGLPSDVEVAGGDLTAPETLDGALDGIDAVLLVWMAGLAPAAAAVERIARHAGRIVFVTSPHKTPHPFFQQPNGLRLIHAGVEALVQKTAVEWTFLRPGAFALNCRNWWAPQIRQDDVVRWFYGDAETAPVHEADIAAVAVRALRDEGHDRKEYVLTGPESLTQREQVHIIGNAIGRSLSFEELPPDAARQQLLSMWPAPVADMLLSAYAAAVGQPAFVTSTIAELTGNPAASFEQWTTDHAEDFKGQLAN